MFTSQISKLRETEGFTLIELLIVVVIIGILAAIAIPQFSSTKEKAFDSSAQSDIRNMQTAQEAYFADNQTYGGVDISPSADGGSGDIGGDTDHSFTASPQVGITAEGGTDGYTIQAQHNSSDNCFGIDTAGDESSITEDGGGCGG